MRFACGGSICDGRKLAGDSTTVALEPRAAGSESLLNCKAGKTKMRLPKIIRITSFDSEVVGQRKPDLRNHRLRLLGGIVTRFHAKAKKLRGVIANTTAQLQRSIGPVERNLLGGIHR